MTTSDRAIKRALPAEGAYPPAILLAWPHEATDWQPMLRRVDMCYREIASAIASLRIPMLIIHPEAKHITSSLAPEVAEHTIPFNYLTNDTWTRDYGQITVRESDRWTACDFKFNGWGLKFAADHDNLVTSALFDSGIISGNYENQLGFVLEGGSIESDGRGTVLTTSRCLLSPNRNGDLDRVMIERALCMKLGAERVLWLDHGGLDGDDTDSHIDTLARLAPNDTILYVKSYRPTDSHTDELNLMEQELAALRTPEGKPYNLVGLPLPEAIYDDNGERLPATYANFLITPRTVLMPTYRQPDNDRMAGLMLQTVFADREIVAVDCTALIKQHGSLHCATMQLPAGALCL